MELLQKLTLYDLLGYTVPGILCLWIYDWGHSLRELCKGEDGQASYWILVIIIGYTIGIMITVLAELLVSFLNWIGIKEKKWDNLSGNYGISKADIVRAMKRAKMKSFDLSDEADTLLYKYRSYMYSDIQSDEKYSRIHNYASAELLCKNVAVVFLMAIVMGLYQKINIKIVIGFVGAVFFMLRWIKCSERKSGYAACWFVQKYTHSNR